jgi:alkylation response protein AidB-like acyl-CoA dehydrogenase
VDLRGREGRVTFDESAWKTSAFAETKTSLASFDAVVVTDSNLVGEEGFYLERPGFWHGAIGPAACWAGGASGVLRWALKQQRSDAHTLAHLGGMSAAVWSTQAALRVAGDEIDADWQDVAAAQARALRVRHLVEQACTDVLRRLARAYGPHPLAMEEAISRRYQELEIYVRQSHAERDLEALGQLVHQRK